MKPPCHPNLPGGRGIFKNRNQRWWRSHGQAWTAQLRQVLIDHRNIGHDWQFSQEQVDLLNQYLAANQLLVECLKRSDVSRAVRQEIEDTLLLPLAALESKPEQPGSAPV